MKKSSIPWSRLAFALSLAAALVAPARAGVDVDFGASMHAGNHHDLFLSISSRYFERDLGAVESWARRIVDPDDLSVFLFVVQHTGNPSEFVFRLREQGLSWWDVSLRVGMPVDAWFVPVEGNPGRPYRKAYGHWRKQKARNRPSARFRLSDEDLRNLVAVRVMHEYYRLPAERAMEIRSSGRDLRSLLVEEYENRHGKGMSAVKEKPRKRGRGGEDGESR